MPQINQLRHLPLKKIKIKKSTFQARQGIAPFFAPIYLLNHLLILIEIRINKILKIIFMLTFTGNNKVAVVCSKHFFSRNRRKLQNHAFSSEAGTSVELHVTENLDRLAASSSGFNAKIVVIGLNQKYSTRNLRLWSLSINALAETRRVKTCVYQTAGLRVTDT